MASRPSQRRRVVLSIGSSDEDRRIDDMIRYLTGDGAPSLSDWEEEFIDSVKEQWEHRGSLTDRQIEKLEQVYDKH